MRTYLSQEELQALSLAGALRQDVHVHTAAVDDLAAHAGLLQGLAQLRDDLLRLLALCCEVVAQLVRALLRGPLRPLQGPWTCFYGLTESLGRRTLRLAVMMTGTSVQSSFQPPHWEPPKGT